MPAKLDENTMKRTASAKRSSLRVPPLRASAAPPALPRRAREVSGAGGGGPPARRRRRAGHRPPSARSLAG